MLLSPDGQDWLSSAHRGPEHLFGRRTSSAINALNQLALRYPTTDDQREALVQDFHSFRQALNVASADQRVLVLVHAPDNEDELRESFKQVANNPAIVGRFHIDFETERKWTTQIKGAKSEPSIVVIRPGEFGLKGEVMHQISLDASGDEITKTLLKANRTFASTTAKKVYSQHVDKGRRQGVYFEGAVPYGEDRDGDGQIDSRGRRRR